MTDIQSVRALSPIICQCTTLQSPAGIAPLRVAAPSDRRPRPEIHVQRTLVQVRELCKPSFSNAEQFCRLSDGGFAFRYVNRQLNISQLFVQLRWRWVLCEKVQHKACGGRGEGGRGGDRQMSSEPSLGRKAPRTAEATAGAAFACYRRHTPARSTDSLARGSGCRARYPGSFAEGPGCSFLWSLL